MHYLTTGLLLLLVVLACQRPPSDPASEGGSAGRVGMDRAFSVDELQRRTFNYFWETALPGNYQIPDRWPTRRFSSIAATGFGLSAYLVGSERGYVSREAAAERTLLTLEKLWSLPQGDAPGGVAGYKGLFYHFLTNDEALRYKNVELSTIDSGLLMAGVLSAQSYFADNNSTETRIRALADSLYRRVEWDWALNAAGRLSMGWHPEKGYIPADWNGYNEAMILLVLALGSPTHPVPDNAWEKWTEDYEWAEFQGQEHLNFSPLFGHQYSHMYIDFRGIQDAYMRSHGSDYFQNSRKATLANRAYCMENPRGFVGYGPLEWGLTACDGPASLDTLYRGQPVRFFTYRARGASALHVVDDGTIAPTAAGGSVPFAPAETLAALEHMWTTHYDSLVGPYGFKDAYNLSYTYDATRPGGWFDVDYLGIDQGPILIQIENHRSELLWNLMKKNPYIRRGLERAGFTGGWLAEGNTGR
ncbi:glucoamylase family protein [Neolewinella lacunae]|uniref:Tat pathway signal protein n=1 Tax=Neolewinella lacunae TaxID=1517758 RepID=A0A923TDN1_9BACT|nr:glucoamylase family protein [Neolewinella lacunae]MBC6995022.1 Tat pathway signal protein [Neolewinella lacunae]MDN3633207.1 glucoamylase family protein [Neolewinella lacunae]